MEDTMIADFRVGIQAFRRGWAASLLAMACLMLTPVTSDARVKSNSQLRLPSRLYLGDIDGDGIADLLQTAGNRLFAARTNYEATGLLHQYFEAPVQRLVIGDFTTGGREHGRDQVCAVLEGGVFSC